MSYKVIIRCFNFLECKLINLGIILKIDIVSKFSVIGDKLFFNSGDVFFEMFFIGRNI